MQQERARTGERVSATFGKSQRVSESQADVKRNSILHYAKYGGSLKDRQLTSVAFKSNKAPLTNNNSVYMRIMN